MLGNAGTYRGLPHIGEPQLSRRIAARADYSHSEAFAGICVFFCKNLTRRIPLSQIRRRRTCLEKP